MSHTLETFERQKAQALETLEKLGKFIDQGRKIGVKLPLSLSQKIAQGLTDLQQQPLRIALVGGFSEGKTALAAAWLGRLDSATMQISQRESSNAISVYDIDGKLQLIDTPGLYGFKEKFNPDTREQERYQDITRQYISEAHLVLYVMNATNPVKESHADELRWLFRTLGLLPRTVFVLSRFDEVADVEDDLDYQEKLQIKRQSLASRLDNVLHLSVEERQALSIVAVSANPFGLGTQHWLQHMAQFQRLSHIGLLQQATQEKMASSGGAMTLAQAVRHTIITDVIEKQLPIARQGAADLLAETQRLAAIHREQQNELFKVQGRITQAQVRLEGKIVRYFEDLILQAKGTNPDTFADFYHREIGSEATLIQQRLKEYFVEEVSSITEDLSRIQITIESEISHFNDTITALGKQGIQYLAGSNLINNQSVLAARDGLNSIARTLGVDIGKYLAFQSWGAVNLAKGINGMLSILGLALEVWDTWKQEQRKRAFHEAVEKICQQLAQESRNIVAGIETETFATRFFPSLAPLKTQLAEISQELERLRSRLASFEAWSNQGDAIHEAFQLLDAAHQAGYPTTSLAAHALAELPAAETTAVEALPPAYAPGRGDEQLSLNALSDTAGPARAPLDRARVDSAPQNPEIPAPAKRSFWQRWFS